jgi:hypothetical protein
VVYVALPKFLSIYELCHVVFFLIRNSRESSVIATGRNFQLGSGLYLVDSRY